MPSHEAKRDDRRLRFSTLRRIVQVERSLGQPDGQVTEDIEERVEDVEERLTVVERRVDALPKATA